MLRFLTAGESHVKATVATLEGVPAVLTIAFDAVTNELRRRQTGYGRGRRMAIESDRAEALSGIRHGETTGGPIALMIPNKDWENWQRTMHVEAEMPSAASGADRPAVTRPRPGHADLAGFVKYGHEDMRNVLERASARETAARVAVVGRGGCSLPRHPRPRAWAGDRRSPSPGPRASRRSSCGAAIARAARRWRSRGRPTTPAASKAASRTVKISA